LEINNLLQRHGLDTTRITINNNLPIGTSESGVQVSPLDVREGN